MMRSLYSGVSGLKNHQTRMDVIGNNIANVNTAGFKGSRVTFQDMLSQTITGASSPQGNKGGTNPQQIGLGMTVASIDTVFTDGSVQSTGKNTDLCISGNGFFVMSDGAKEYYTRNGAFEFDSQGNYVLPGSGLNVKGWIADANGNVSTSGPLTNIVVPSGQTMAAVATTKAEASGNLSAEAPVGYIYTMKATPAATKTMAVGDSVYDAKGNVIGTVTVASTAPGGEFTFKTKDVATTPPTQIFDSGVHKLGTTVVAGSTDTMTARATKDMKVGDSIYDATGTNVIGTVTVAASAGSDFTFKITEDPLPTPLPTDICDGKGSPANAAITVDPADLVSKAGGEKNTKLISFAAYDSQGIKHTISGNLVKSATNEWIFTPTSPADSGATVSTNDIVIKFDANGNFLSGSGAVTITPVDPPLGSSVLTVSLDFSGMKQYAGETNVSVEKDGNAAGVLDSVSTDSSGMIVGSFSNGMKKNLAQVALATFNNPAGLTKEGSSLFSKSNNSGEVKISTAGSGGAGTLTPSAIEMSNVNLSDQFSDMIVTQRGFQSNSKIITVSDEMIETLVNMKR